MSVESTTKKRLSGAEKSHFSEDIAEMDAELRAIQRGAMQEGRQARSGGRKQADMGKYNTKSEAKSLGSKELNQVGHPMRTGRASFHTRTHRRTREGKASKNGFTPHARPRVNCIVSTEI